VITRGFDQNYSEGCEDAPPPLHVYQPSAQHAAWHPLGHPADAMPQQSGGPVLVTIPQPGGTALGDDPTNPAASTWPWSKTAGMVGRLHPTVGGQ